MLRHVGLHICWKIQISVLFRKSLPISFVAAHHPGHRRVIPGRGESFPS